MACSHVDGTYHKVILLEDGTDTPFFDPVLSLTAPNGGKFNGRFAAHGEQNFEGTCANTGQQSHIEFIRKHPDEKTTTVYKGKVFRVVDEEVDKVCIRGKFERTTLAAVTTQKGDWETERPT